MPVVSLSGAVPIFQLRVPFTTVGAVTSLLHALEKHNCSVDICAGAGGRRNGRSEEAEENGPEDAARTDANAINRDSSNIYKYTARFEIHI